MRDSTLSVRLKRMLLVVFALVVLALAIGPLWGYAPASPLRAQQSSSPLETPTWTPSPTWTPYIPPGQVMPSPTPTRSRKVVNEIDSPGPGDAVAGATIIRGTGLIVAFRRYELHISPTSADNWQWLTTSYNVVRDGILYIFDTTRFPDGYYDLRLRAIDDHGAYTETFVRALEIRNANPPTPTPVIDVAGNAVILSPLSTPTPTAPPVPRRESRIDGGQGFYGPDSGADVRGQVPIYGTVNGWWYNPFARYELAISPTSANNWSWLFGSEQEFWQSQIYLLDTTQFADGYYDLRLRIVYFDGNYDEFFLRALHVVNNWRPAAQPAVGFLAPASNSTIAGVVDFRGVVTGPNLLRWQIDWSPAGQEQWVFVVSSERAISGGSLATLDLSQLTPGLYDFRLRVIYKDLTRADYFIRNLTLVAATPTPPAAASIPTPPGQ